ncbi:MAG: class I SAM-dependent methyltransferase [Vulcanimicrobiota bacterium]
MLYFDKKARLYPLDSQALHPYNVERWSPVTKSRMITNGRQYFAVPKSELNPPPPTAIADLEELQSYFFSEQAVEAALAVAPELLGRDDSGSLIHGTTGARAFTEALGRVAAGPGDSFLDIGCGCGLPVLVASRVLGRAHGVDVVPSVIRFAREAASRFHSQATFAEADIKEVRMETYDIVYIAATTFSDELRASIQEKLAELRAGAIAISLTYSFSCPHLVLVDSFESPFAWWKTSAPSPHRFYIHMRRAE